MAKHSMVSTPWIAFACAALVAAVLIYLIDPSLAGTLDAGCGGGGR